MPRGCSSNGIQLPIQALKTAQQDQRQVVKDRVDHIDEPAYVRLRRYREFLELVLHHTPLNP